MESFRVYLVDHLDIENWSLMTMAMLFLSLNSIQIKSHRKGLRKRTIFMYYNFILLNSIHVKCDIIKTRKPKIETRPQPMKPPRPTKSSSSELRFAPVKFGVYRYFWSLIS